MGLGSRVQILDLQIMRMGLMPWVDICSFKGELARWLNSGNQALGDLYFRTLKVAYYIKHRKL
jgi:hypothetical protein